MGGLDRGYRSDDGDGVVGDGGDGVVGDGGDGVVGDGDGGVDEKFDAMKGFSLLEMNAIRAAATAAPGKERWYTHGQSGASVTVTPCLDSEGRQYSCIIGRLLTFQVYENGLFVEDCKIEESRRAWVANFLRDARSSDDKEDEPWGRM